MPYPSGPAPEFFGGQPILYIFPDERRGVGSTLECGTRYMVCTDPNCIFLTGEWTNHPTFYDALTYTHHKKFVDGNFSPCAPPITTDVPAPDIPSYSGIPENCLTKKEPSPGSGWEQNWVGTGGVGISIFPDQPNAKYSPRKCWRCLSGNCGGTPPPNAEIVIKREAPKLAYYRSPIDLNMVYEISESDYAYPQEPWVQRTSVLQGGLGVIPPAANNPFTIHYPCPIYGRKSITKICRIRQSVFGDLLDMRQFSWGTAPFVSTEITRVTALPPIPGQPKFTNASNYKYVPSTGAAFSYTFTVAEVIDPATNVKIKNVQDSANVYADYTLPSYLTYNNGTLTISGIVPSDLIIMAEATNTATGNSALFPLYVVIGPDPTTGGGETPHQVDVYGQLPFINQDFLVYFPTASAVQRDFPTAGINTWYMGNDIYIECPNVVRSRLVNSFWAQSNYYPTFALPLDGILLSGAWGYVIDTTSMFSINIYTTSYTPTGLYNIPMDLDLQMIPQALEPYWTDQPTKEQVVASPEAFRDRGPTPQNPSGYWEGNLVRNWQQISNRIIYLNGFVSFEVTKDTCPKPEGKFVRVLDRPDLESNRFDVIAGERFTFTKNQGGFTAFPDEP